MVKIIVTGGSLDKLYDHINEKFYFNQTCILDILQTGKCAAPFSVQLLMLMDSNLMDDYDRSKILDNVICCKDTRIIITHGTDSMTQTANLLGENIKDKIIVLCGAMIPHSFKDSDATFNLAFALGAVQTLPKGVYVAMHGQVFPYNQVIKNKSEGKFELSNEFL